MRVLFFASLRDAVGMAELTLETSVDGFDGLMAELAARLPSAAVEALTDSSVRVAIDQQLIDDTATLAGSLDQVRELAFLPPVTGG